MIPDEHHNPEPDDPDAPGAPGAPANSDEAPTVGEPPAAANTGPERPGGRIGPYMLLKIVGEGSFGVVWLAERRDPIVQRVAIKIIKPGMESRSVIARFEQERQALALMQHPHIARVTDAGATTSGRPYFVTEYVNGEPITSYCNRNRLTIRERLELFALVCDAAQHAHQKGVIHRDFKPANILVAETEAGPVPKIIDFGVAKALSPLLGHEGVLTEVGQIVGTINYMSPEQSEMSPDIDTRSDVFSLGVVLYELLAGMLPFEKATARSTRSKSNRERLRDSEPPRPSTRLSTVDAEIRESIATQRREDRDQLLRELARELEWIPLKALRHDRSERYATPADLARDIRRYLKGEPLDAAPESRIYRTRKFIRRNRTAVIAGAVVAITLTLGLIGTSLGLYAAMEQSRRAEAETARATRIAAIQTRAQDYLGEVFRLATPAELGRGASREQVLERALQRIPPDTIDTTFASAVRLAIAGSFQDMGRIDRAMEICEEARAHLTDDSVEAQLQRIEIDQLCASLMVDLRRFDEASSLLEDLRRRAGEHFTPDSETMLRLDRNYAVVQRRNGRDSEAETLYQMLLSRATHALGSNAPLTIAIQGDVVSLLIDLGRPDEAVSLARDALRRTRAPAVDVSPEQTIRLLYNAAQAARAADEPALAAEWHGQAFELAAEYMGLDHPRATLVAANTASSLIAIGQRQRAAEILDECIKAVERVHGEDDHTLVRLLAVRAMARLEPGFTHESQGDAVRARRVLDLHGEDRVGAASVRILREAEEMLAQDPTLAGNR